MLHWVHLGSPQSNAVYENHIYGKTDRFGDCVLDFLENWCFHNLHGYFVTQIQPHGLLFMFRDRREAVLFKLTWG